MGNTFSIPWHHWAFWQQHKCKLLSTGCMLVKKLKRVTSFLVQNIESDNDDDWNEDKEICKNWIFNKKMKISWWYDNSMWLTYLPVPSHYCITTYNNNFVQFSSADWQKKHVSDFDVPIHIIGPSCPPFFFRGHGWPSIILQLWWI